MEARRSNSVVCRFQFHLLLDAMNSSSISIGSFAHWLQYPALTWRHQVDRCASAIARRRRGKCWYASALSGNKARGYGILRNPLYGGVIRWNRVRMVKDPRPVNALVASTRPGNRGRDLIRSKARRVNALPHQIMDGARQSVAAQAAGCRDVAALTLPESSAQRPHEVIVRGRRREHPDRALCQMCRRRLKLRNPILTGAGLDANGAPALTIADILRIGVRVVECPLK